ncbi:MAG: cobalamin-binding protein [Gemmatimonadales bacterium]|nr:MAG: cobalamin-binding protein [Gemmatimonadales bacterium]
MHGVRPDEHGRSPVGIDRGIPAVERHPGEPRILPVLRREAVERGRVGLKTEDHRVLHPAPIDLERAFQLYLAALLEGDRRAAVRVTEEAARSHPITSVYRQIVEAAQVEVGECWARNEISVAREHMATAISQYVLGTLYAHLPIPERTLGRAVITGVEGEKHQLGSHMVADLLEAEGWSVRFLGTQVPHRDIVEVAREHGAKAVGISATMLTSLDGVDGLIRDLRETLGPELRIVVGGRAFPAGSGLWRELGADATGRNLDEALEAFRTLLP